MNAKEIEKILFESFKRLKLNEQGDIPPPPTNDVSSASPPMDSSIPPSQPGIDPNAQPQQPQITIDTIIEKLNIVRRGKSFNDKVLYEQLSSFFNALSEEDKASLDRLVGQIAQIVLDNLPQNNQMPNSSTPQQPPAQPPVASPPQQSQPMLPIA